MEPRVFRFGKIQILLHLHHLLLLGHLISSIASIHHDTITTGTPYEDMYSSLAATPEDVAYFVKNGVLQLCQRGAAVKRAPQRWQDMPSEFIAKHDVVIAFEERIFDAVIEDLQLRQPTEDFRPIHVICLDTKDNPHGAARQGIVALRLCWMLEHAEDLDMEAAEIIDQFQRERDSETSIKILYQVCYL